MSRLAWLCGRWPSGGAVPQWEYGTAGSPERRWRARRHRKHGNVQFVLWPAGQQGHTEGYWHDSASSWWPTFVADER